MAVHSLLLRQEAVEFLKEESMTVLTGKLLRIDLSNNRHFEEEIPVQYYRKFISARGLSAKYLYDELKPGTDPLGSENRLILSIGVLGGTGLQGFSK
jgi:aldehyde:ferredoxin oxidoreductase